MKDRLAQLRAVQEEIPLEEVAIANTTQEGISIGEGEGLDSFLSRCSNSLNDLERLKEYLERMKIIHATILSKPEQDGEFAEELRSLMAKFATESKQLRSIAHELDFEANKTRSTNQSAAHRRIKKEQSRMFSSALFQVINNFNIEQENYKTKHLQGISRSLQIQGLEVSDEEVLSAIDKGEIGALTKGLMLAVSDKTALFHEVKSRQEEILALESGIRELHELFQDVQHLGEMVDNIEQHIDVAGEYVIKGQKDIKIIKKAQKRARKKSYPYKMARTRSDTYGDAFIKLVSSDGHEFIIKKKLALKSGTINSMLSGPGQYVENENNEVNFREIPSRVLRKVCHFFSYTSCYTGFYAEIPEFEIDADEALELLMTANFLDC